MAKYVKKPITVEAVQLIYPATLTTSKSVEKAKPGDYLVTAGIEQFFLPKAVFELTYDKETDPDTNATMEISNLQATEITDTSFKLTFMDPPDADFKSVVYYVNGVESSPTIGTDNLPTFELLTPETDYVVKVTALDESNNESFGVSITVTTGITPVV